MHAFVNCWRWFIFIVLMHHSTQKFYWMILLGGVHSRCNSGIDQVAMWSPPDFASIWCKKRSFRTLDCRLFQFPKRPSRILISVNYSHLLHLLIDQIHFLLSWHVMNIFCAIYVLFYLSASIKCKRPSRILLAFLCMFKMHMFILTY